MPSLFEPCGLAQLIALQVRHGARSCAPSAAGRHRVRPRLLRAPPRQRNGYVFHHADHAGARVRDGRAIGLWYDYPSDFRQLMLNGMRARSLVDAARPATTSTSTTTSGTSERHIDAPGSTSLPSTSTGCPTSAGAEALIEAAIADAADAAGVPRTPGSRGSVRRDRQRLRDRAAHAPAADPGRRRRPAHGGAHQQPAVHDGAPGHRRQPQRAGVPLVLQADGRVHPAAARRGRASRG